MIRTFKFDLEDGIGKKVPVDHPAFSWLVEHASWVMTSRSQLDDGTIPYQQVRGHKFH